MQKLARRVEEGDGDSGGDLNAQENVTLFRAKRQRMADGTLYSAKRVRELLPS
jgi:hypothetical protein